jgi:uncharacterized BrkB/YihY/UPF0761 family membrane protein
MADLWGLRGLSLGELAKRTCRKSCDDEVFGQAAHLASYYFLSMFPVLLLFFILLDRFASAGSIGSNLRDTLLGAFQQILTRETATLMEKAVAELNAGAIVDAESVFAGLSAAKSFSPFGTSKRSAFRRVRSALACRTEPL